MLTLDELKARYSKTETEIDDVGRIITVSLLRPAEHTRVLEMTDSTSGYVLLRMLRAASVRKITNPDGKEMMFAPPTNRDDIDVVQNVLDREGMTAVVKALERLDPPADDGKPKDVAEEAKN